MVVFPMNTMTTAERALRLACEKLEQYVSATARILGFEAPAGTKADALVAYFTAEAEKQEGEQDASS